ncbi:MAG: DNA primase family protein [Flavisolibacter sp.]
MEQKPLKAHKVNEANVSNKATKNLLDYEREVNNVKQKTVDKNEIRQHSEILNSLLEDMKPIDFYALAELPTGERLSRKHYVVLVIQEIQKVAKKRNWSLLIIDGIVSYFNGAFWKELSKDVLQRFVGKAAEKLGVDKFDAQYHQFKKELLLQFYSTYYLQSPDKKEDEVLINLSNGTFVITADSQSMKGFDKSDYLTYQLPFSFSPGLRAPLFEMYLNRVLPDVSQQKILAEYIAYLFIRQKVLKLEKALILFGNGANGKSVFFEIITALLGHENISTYSLQSLTDRNGYYRAKIANKLCNYASEISPQMDSTLFKQLVSGEPVEARLPYREPITIRNYAKLIFNTNELPKDTEQTDAFFRRFLILHFSVTIPESERNPQLASQIITNELPGVFNWVLGGLQRLLAQKRFTHSEVAEAIVEQYKMDSDSVQLFLSDSTYEKSMNSHTALKQMFSEFKNFCQESNYKCCSTKIFSERLRKLGFELTRRNTGFFVNAGKLL